VDPIAIMSGHDRSMSACALRLAAGAAVPFYAGGVFLRNLAFDSGLRRPRRLGRPVISVGNLTAGGTGKTPVVVALVRELARRGHRPAVLLRGYRSTAAHGSDEARLLEAQLGPEVPVEPDPSRIDAASRVLGRRPQTDLFVLDDGFQHRQVARDIDIVLVDATRPFGFDHLLPRGLLRELPGGLRRAHAVVVTRADGVSEAQVQALAGRIEQLAGRPPLAAAAFRWTGFRDDRDGRAGPDALRDRKVAGVCAIGNPAPFQRELEERTAGIVLMRVLPDHHDFGEGEAEAIVRQAGAAGATAVVMTEKDYVKWPARTWPLPVYRPILEVEFTRGGQDLFELIQARIASGPTCPRE
jgi:tetraacyldisaccharide 4'-kinase